MLYVPGALCQNAFIVEDLEAAVAHWTRILSVGPFFWYPKLQFTAGELHGKPHLPSFEGAIAYSGELMIELIQPQGPSIFQEFLDEGGRGVHHNCVLTGRFALAEANFLARGGKRVQAQTAIDGSRFAYFEFGGQTPVVIELAQLKPACITLFQLIREAAAAWDGRKQYLHF
jgi:hypothetical protein